ncbi:MAG: alpha/beta hydrolase, partial [Sporichthyaceae bacterium]|nr:alpha/beta hydrolase [Sporichthyaceae bacterium]
LGRGVQQRSAGGRAAEHHRAQAAEVRRGTQHVVGPSLALTPFDRERGDHIVFEEPVSGLAPSRVPQLGRDPAADWAKYNRQYWQDHYEDFLWFFLGQCFPEPHSTKPIEDAVGWGLETTGAVLAAEYDSADPDRRTLEQWCARITSPMLVIHGTDDRISPLRRSELLAELTGGELVVIDGGGHIPLARDPVQVNLLIHEFTERVRPTPAPSRQHWARWEPVAAPGAVHQLPDRARARPA